MTDFSHILEHDRRSFSYIQGLNICKILWICCFKALEFKDVWQLQDEYASDQDLEMTKGNRTAEVRKHQNAQEMNRFSWAQTQKKVVF